MKKIVLNIDGMACAMCESHINDAVRRAFPVKKVTSSRKKKETVILSESAISEEKLRQVIDSTGYRLLGIRTETVEKRGFFFRNGSKT